MKKIFTLTMLALLAVGSVNAQIKKTWDFSKGWSDETIENLKADTQNWTFEYNTDGSIKTIKEATKLTGDFIANGQPIKELIGLTRGTVGLSKNNNYLLTTSTFRLNRDNQEIIFPKLKGGQTITIVGKSANATAENRGIKPSYDYIVRTEGPEDNLIRASLGTVTNKWIVQGDATQEYDIKFQMITGGIDFTLFMIDEGDVTPNAKVAFLYKGSVDTDAAYNILKAREKTDVTPIDVTATSITAEQLRSYDVTVVSASLSAEDGAVSVVKDALPWTPVLNLNGQMYGAWAYGTSVSVSGLAKLKTTKGDLLQDVAYVEADEGNVLVVSESGANVEAVHPGSYFEGDDTIAIDLSEENPSVFVHTHNIKHNGYIYFPYASDYSAGATQFLKNAIGVLQESKSEITKTPDPVITQEFKDMNTNVSVTPGRVLPKTRIFYTTDGSAPTTNSTEYTGVVNLTSACTFKAVAIAEGYTLSDEASLGIEIKSQPKTPVISDVQENGKTTVTLTCESEDVDIWYNFNNSSDTLLSTKYFWINTSRSANRCPLKAAG